MREAQVSERALVHQFVAALNALPDVQAQHEHASARVGELLLGVAGRRIRVLIESRKAVFPRDVQQLLWRIGEPHHRHGAEERGDAVVAVLLAESTSPGAKELLRDERVGYLEQGGSLYLPARGTYLLVDRPPPRSLTRTMRTLFTGRRAQVLHALLVRHAEWHGAKDLAAQARVSPATVSQLLTEMERIGWLETRDQGPGKQRYVREPSAVLDAWAQQVGSTPPPVPQRYFVPAVATGELMERLDDACAAHGAEYAISFEAAAHRHAPFLSSVSQVRCRLLAGPEGNAAIAQLGARAVSEGANLLVVEAASPGELLFRERTDGVWLARPVQVYLDLLGSQGRAREMAEHLRREKIGF